jgi:hypothetical protein
MVGSPANWARHWLAGSGIDHRRAARLEPKGLVADALVGLGARRRHGGRPARARTVLGQLDSLGARSAVDALAVARIVRFIQQDTLIDTQREWLQGWLVNHRQWKAMELLNCPWCLSVHVAIGWTALRLLAPRIAAPVGTALASSYAASAMIELMAKINTDDQVGDQEAN